MAELIYKTYGKAIFNLAKEENKIEEIEQQTKIVLDILRENQQFITLLNHPKIVKEEKIQLIENTFEKSISRQLLGLMIIIIKKDRYVYLEGILNYFLELVKEEKGIIEAYVISAIQLNEDQKNKIIQRLITLTNKKVKLNYSVDTKLIAGMTIRIGDRIVDNSIKGKINKMTKELKNIQLV